MKNTFHYTFPVTYRGTYRPIRHPTTIPTASDHRGVSFTLVIFLMITDVKEPKNAPNPSLNVLPRPARVSSPFGRKGANADIPKNNPPLSIIPKTRFAIIPVTMEMSVGKGYTPKNDITLEESLIVYATLPKRRINIKHTRRNIPNFNVSCFVGWLIWFLI